MTPAAPPAKRVLSRCREQRQGTAMAGYARPRRRISAPPGLDGRQLIPDLTRETGRSSDQAVLH